MHRLVVVACSLALALAACGPQNEPASRSTSTAARAVVINTAKLAKGPAPKVAWVDARGVHSGSTIIPLTGDEASDVAILGNGLVVVAQLPSGDAEVQVRDATGATTAHFTHGVGRLVTNQERNIVAWSDQGGVIWVLQKGHDQPLDLTHPSHGLPVNPVAITGHDCFRGPEEVEGGGCSVYFTRYAQEGRGTAMVASSHGFSDKASDQITELNDVSPAGALLGLVNPMSHKLCYRFESEKKTYGGCDLVPASFSPDARRFLAYPALITEGPTTDEITVRNAATGKAQLTVRSPKGSSTIWAATWEDSSHVLLVIAQDETPWAIVRVGLDGKAEVARRSGPESSDHVSNVFSVQP